MTYKSHLINFCYLPYLQMNFPIGTITFLLDFARLKTLCLFYFYTTLIVYLFCTTSHHHFPSLWRKKRIRRKKAPTNTEKQFLMFTFVEAITKNYLNLKKVLFFLLKGLLSLSSCGTTSFYYSTCTLKDLPQRHNGS